MRPRYVVAVLFAVLAFYGAAVIFVRLVDVAVRLLR